MRSAYSLSLLLLLALPVAAEQNPPRINYMLHCMGCHFADGAGFAGAVPQMKDFAGKFLHVPGGREFLIQVPGVAQSALEDAELADVMNWLLKEFSANELPADFVPYTALEVGELRKTKLIEVTRTREHLISTFPAD